MVEHRDLFGRQHRGVNADVVDRTVDIVDMAAVVEAVADEGIAGGFPAGRVGGCAHGLAVDVEGDGIGICIVHTDEVVPCVDGGGKGGGDIISPYVVVGCESGEGERAGVGAKLQEKACDRVARDRDEGLIA